jgi:hypothetical protein
METIATASALTRASATPPGQQNVAVVSGASATGTIQAPANQQSSIWFAYVANGTAVLNVNFNGQNFPNVAPGQYQLSNLSTTLNLNLTVGNGSAKLAWINS